MSAPPSFFAELQRRHVYKVGAAYAVAGWLLVQVVTQVFPISEVSAHAQRLFVGGVIAGFPVALVLAWLFDVTPAGIVRTEALPAEGRTPRADSRFAVFCRQPGMSGRLHRLFDRQGLLVGSGLRRARAGRLLALVALDPGCAVAAAADGHRITGREGIVQRVVELFLRVLVRGAWD